MDSLTHLYFAHRLLVISKSDASASVCSLFPQIDRVPAYFHRLYGHPIAQIPILGPLGNIVYRDGKVPENPHHHYSAQRFLQERERMQRFEKLYEQEASCSLGPHNLDYRSMVIGYISHIYQDTFNNPVQAFLPTIVYPCAQWSLWKRIGTVDFRLILYQKETIQRFRQELFSHSMWDTKCSADALVFAMILRTASACTTKIPAKVLKQTFRGIGFAKLPDKKDLATALRLFLRMEKLMSDLTLRLVQREVEIRQLPVPS